MRIDAKFIKNMWLQETPAGTINGVNTVFVLSQIPKEPNSLQIFLAGLFVPQSSYSLIGNTVTFAVAPAISSVLRATYIGNTGE